VLGVFRRREVRLVAAIRHVDPLGTERSKQTSRTQGGRRLRGRVGERTGG
jgi:hypothetical protein